MIGECQWRGQRRRAIQGQEPRLERTAITRKFIQQRGEIIEMVIALAIVDYSAETRFQLAYSEPLYIKAYRMELRPNRRKGEKLSAQFKAKMPPLCTGGSGLLHTKCVFISVTPPRKVWRIKLSV